ncbi:MAG TPA: metalloregulator ArsR/SmtB family transcription factor [Planctomycetota bacterium]|nr:metalloregulator ArsR/SmtB family transcription factor [Planctomycetota bacterium]
MIGLTGTSRLLKALADDTRLRILNLLAQEELAGSDLMEILNMGQSRVSTHLALLKEVGLVNDRREGRRSLYSIAPGPAAGLWGEVLAENVGSPEFDADLAGLEVLRQNRRAAKRAYFDRVAASFGEQLLPGRTWEGLARAILQLAPRGRYADLGVGDGLLTLMLAEVAEVVTAVDISPEMLGQLATRARSRGIANIETVEGEIEDLPLPERSHDVVVMSQALHHARDPLRALEEAHRVLAPGGRLLLIDLLAHSEEWVREKLEHVHLGFTEAWLADALARAGFAGANVQRAARDPQPPHFMTLVASARRPA